ncbi:MAG: LysM peptidoglycan-binding domain-containing protein, partial [Oscillospiraceae bacterium]
MIIHVVRPGDNIYKISKEYGIPAEKITDVNRLPNADSLVIGQTIVIPGDLTAHTVTSGQSMYSLAR